MNKETININGYTIEKPAAFPVSFNEFLRIVIGGSIASARTETNRTKHLRDFLRWWTMATAKVNPKSKSQTAPQMLADSRKGFSEQKFDLWAEMFLNWRSGLLQRRAHTAASKRWNKKIA